jgi:hypothetical protein
MRMYADTNGITAQLSDTRDSDSGPAARIWQKKAHIRDGSLYIPGVAFKAALDKTAKLSNEKIPGKGMQTFTLGFAAGGQCAVELIKSKRSGWRSAIHAAQWSASLATYCRPGYAWRRD